MPDVPKLLIILGSTREQRRGEPIARWLADHASSREDLTCELVDLATYQLPLLSNATPPMTPSSREDAVREWAAKVTSADGYVFVVPEYNHGASAAVKNSLDHLFAEWNRKPIGFVSYGGLSGGVRAVEQLRQVAVELEMVPVRRQVAIQRIWAAIGENGELVDPPIGQADQLLDDMAWWASILRDGRVVTAAA